MVIWLASARKELQSRLIYAANPPQIFLCTAGGRADIRRPWSDTFRSNAATTFAQSFPAHSETRAAQDQPIFAETSHACFRARCDFSYKTACLSHDLRLNRPRQHY